MFLPPTIDLAHSEKYILSLRIKPTEFMFSLTEPNAGRNYCLRSTQFDNASESLLESVQKIIFELNFLTQQYKKTNVIFVEPEYKLVPSELFDIKQKEKLFDFSSIEKNSFVLSDDIAKFRVNNLYKANEDIHGFLSRSLYNPQFYNHITPLVYLLEGRAKSTSIDARMYINLHDNLMDIICFSGNKLLLSVTYDNLTAQEKSYFILKMWESLAFDQMKDLLLIAGEIEDTALDVLRNYIKNIERVASPSEIFIWHEDAQKAPLDLIALSL